MPFLHHRKCSRFHAAYTKQYLLPPANSNNMFRILNKYSMVSTGFYQERLEVCRTRCCALHRSWCTLCILDAVQLSADKITPTRQDMLTRWYYVLKLI